MINNKKFGKLKVVATSFGTSAAVVLLLGAIFAFGSGEPLMSVGVNSSGQFGVATSSPGSNLSAIGGANFGSLTVEAGIKASEIVATSSLVVRDGDNGLRLKDSDGDDCHKITIDSAGNTTVTRVNCFTGDLLVPIDNFDSYSSGSLGGKNGGVGFSGSWTKDHTGEFTIQTSGCQSSNCIKSDTGGDTRDYRVFPASSSGSGSVYIKRTQNGTNNFEIDICASGTTNCEAAGKFRFAISRLSPYNIVLKSGGTDATLGQYSNSTWQKIDFEWGAGQSQSCSPGEVAARFNSGSWSSCEVMNSGNDPGTINFVTDDTSVGSPDEFWIDELDL